MSALCRKEKFWFLGSLAIVHAAAEAVDGLGVVEQFMPHDFGPPLHVHYGEEQVFHMLAGEARFVVGGEEFTARAGDTVAVPRGVPYTFLITAPEGARWLHLTNGLGFERMMRQVGGAAAHNGLPPAVGQPTPAQIAALDAACRENGIAFAGPPLATAQRAA
jgi:hypothetical protein